MLLEEQERGRAAPAQGNAMRPEIAALQPNIDIAAAQPREQLNAWNLNWVGGRGAWSVLSRYAIRIKRAALVRCYAVQRLVHGEHAQSVTVRVLQCSTDFAGRSAISRNAY